jgi:uncharacterized membrane protein YphA (DoxX/SURF4 family)
MQTTQSFKRYFPEIVSFLFILLFVYAALSKLLDYQKFRLQLGQSPLITSISGLVAWVIPILEISISVILAVPKYRLVGLYASFCLMVMFAAYIIAITRFSSYTPCSCGGVLEKLSWNQHLVFNIVFVLLALSAVIVQVKKDNPYPISG